MKIVIINGSARRGNTLTAIDAFIKGASEKNEIEIIQPDRLHIAPCKGCGACQCYKGCIDQDDTNPTIDKITAADVILFATPVYWWGMSAQLKLIIDKCYCRGLQLKNKKVGTIVVGGSPVDSIQYKLIDKQFDCMAKYLSWDMIFQKSYYATASDELAELQSDLASQKAVAEADSTSLTKEEKDKLEVTDNLSELDAKSAKELVKEGKKGITAEFNGIVSRADIKEGASVSQGMELFTIQNTDKASVDVNLSKYDYDTVKEGQKAEITTGDNTYEGTVTRMSHIAVQNEKGTPVISATVSIDNPDEDIFLGVDAKVKIHTASAKNVVLLPVEVVNIGKEGSFCYVIEDGLVTRRNITTGISSQDYVEVTEGIKAGEQVISDLGDYTEGMAVQEGAEGAGTAEDSGTTAETTDVEEADAAGTKNETGDGADD